MTFDTCRQIAVQFDLDVYRLPPFMPLRFRETRCVEAAHTIHPALQHKMLRARIAMDVVCWRERIASQPRARCVVLDAPDARSLHQGCRLSSCHSGSTAAAHLVRRVSMQYWAMAIAGVGVMCFEKKVVLVWLVVAGTVLGERNVEDCQPVRQRGVAACCGYWGGSTMQRR